MDWKREWVKKKKSGFFFWKEESFKIQSYEIMQKETFVCQIFEKMTKRYFYFLKSKDENTDTTDLRKKKKRQRQRAHNTRKEKTKDTIKTKIILKMSSYVM